jgi:hypothetical protein
MAKAAASTTRRCHRERRAALRRGRQPAHQPGEGALGEHQVLPATAPIPASASSRPGAGGRQADPDELARVGTELFASHYQHFGGDAAKTLAAYNAGRGAVEKAVAKHGAGLARPHARRDAGLRGQGHEGAHRGVGAHAGQDPATVDAARVQVLQRTRGRGAAGPPGRAAAFQDAADVVAAGHFDVQPEIRQARAEMAQLQRDVPDSSEAAVQARAKEIQGAEGVSYKEARGQAAKEIAGLAADHQRRIDRLQAAIERNAKAQQATEALNALDVEHAQVRQQAERTPLPRPIERPTAVAAREAVMDPARPTREPVGAPAAAPAAPAAPAHEVFQAPEPAAPGVATTGGREAPRLRPTPCAPRPRSPSARTCACSCRAAPRP